MKIGIMTFWWSEDNYGQLLQCYALQKYLRDAGHDVYLIKYDPKGDYIKTPIWRKTLKAFNPIELYKFLLNKKRRTLDIQEKRDNPRNFEGFRNKHIKQSDKLYYSYRELVENPPSADVYIVGSDQVWNTFGVPLNKAINVINAYLLNFGDSAIRKISYAASFGKEELSHDFVKIFSPLLKNFDYISVREKSGLDICKRCGIENAEWVSDPTMLLDAGIYRDLYKDETIKKSDKAYCFLYLVGNEFSFSVQSIYDWAVSKDIEVVYVTGNSQQDKYKKQYATIPEWIYLLEHAEYVITNSYHCGLFSLIFRKRFGVIPLSGHNIGMNSRLDSMFQLFKIERRFIGSDFSVLDREIDWKLVAESFQNIKKTCKLSKVI